ncbi:MAG: hypothetical protein MK102_01045 [Fuerstiella sp.]|nr:hypothetical protein [Fuerstiella sp.]
MNQIHECVSTVRRRQQRQWMWHCVSTGLVTSGLIACVLAVARFQWSEIGLLYVVEFLIAGPVLGWCYSVSRSRHERDAAAAIDQEYQLKDRTTTALELLAKSTHQTAWQGLQLEDAEKHLALVEPQTVVPIRAPRSWIWGLGMSLVAVVIALAGTPAERAVGEVTSNRVVIAQANTLEDSLEELREFDTENIDPEMKELLRELTKRLDALRQPGVNPRDALARLSEMEAVLEKKQQNLQSSGTDVQLVEIGTALSLSEKMQTAGAAMVKGELDKAAEELSSLKMPELDPQTEKAITEKLHDAGKNESRGINRKLKEAAAQTAAGLSRKNHNKFEEGMQGLAGECKKQGRRKKLSDLLKKQCRRLSECKSECESEYRKTGTGNGENGDQWGLGRSDNPAEDKTSKLHANNRMNIIGQESSSGDIDTETMTAPETAQEAARRYRDQSKKYEQLTESVLDSEPLPLGHRQTIRRYFQMIRPQSGEIDTVNEETTKQRE